MDDLDVFRRLYLLEPGMHHAASAAGVWLMIGCSLPEEFTWSSVPPADSLSIVWGRGGCSIEHPGGSLVLERGRVMWIEAGHPHRGRGYVGSDFLTVFLPPRRSDVTVRAGAPTRARVASCSESLERSILALTEAVLDGGKHAQELSALRQIISCRPAICDEPGDYRLQPHNLKRAKHLLESRFAEEIGLRALSKAANLSPTHFSRSFANVWTLPPIQYRKQLRLRAATHYLASGQSISTAAASAGFSDSAHLSRTFRAQYGVSPSQWQHRIAGLLYRNDPSHKRRAR